MGTADEGARKVEQAMVLRSDDSLSPPPVAPIALAPGEPIETVCGVPLETGERVVLFFAPTHRAARCLLIAVGVLLAVVLFGIVLILYGVFYDRWHLRFVAVTDRRVIAQKGDRAARWLYLRDVVELRAKRDAAASGGAIATANQSAALATKEAKTDPKFWEGAEAIVVQGKKGALAIDRSVPPTVLGPQLANALYTDGYVAKLPTANYPR